MDPYDGGLIRAEGALVAGQVKKKLGLKKGKLGGLTKAEIKPKVGYEALRFARLCRQRELFRLMVCTSPQAWLGGTGKVPA